MAVDNPYALGNPALDRQRLETQNRLFSTFLRTNLERLVGSNIRRILDLGCGEGLMDPVLHDIYPQAQIVGIDRNEAGIAQARKNAEETGLRNATYVVGDVEQGLPDGPFDLIYISFVLLHTRQQQKILELVYKALRPGGYVWIKEGTPDLPRAINHKSYHKLGDMLFDSLVRIGGNPRLVNDLPAMLHTAGFVNLQQAPESYPLGGSTSEGRALLAIILGLFHNSRSLMTRVHNVSESEIERLYYDVCNVALRSPNDLGSQQIYNFIAQRPLG